MTHNKVSLTTTTSNSLHSVSNNNSTQLHINLHVTLINTLFAATILSISTLYRIILYLHFISPRDILLLYSAKISWLLISWPLMAPGTRDNERLCSLLAKCCCLLFVLGLILQQTRKFFHRELCCHLVNRIVS